MLDLLVESRDNSRANRFRNELLLGTLIVVFIAFMSGLGYSLYASPLIVGGDGLELSTLVAPPIPEEAPPPPEPEEDKPKQTPDDNQSKVAMRTEAIARLDMSPQVPDKVSVEKFTKRTIPNTNFQIGDRNYDPPAGSSTGTPRNVGGGGGFVREEPKEIERDDPKPPPPPPPPPPPSVPKRISKGVVNGQAISLPKPAYPASARAVGAKGSVSVAIVISESGSVISASAVSGHPLLKQAAVSAAQRARFRPTLLSGQPVEVSGVIVYNFQ